MFVTADAKTYVLMSFFCVFVWTATFQIALQLIMPTSAAVINPMPFSVIQVFVQKHSRFNLS